LETDDLANWLIAGLSLETSKQISFSQWRNDKYASSDKK